jgi:hypothetical protein
LSYLHRQRRLRLRQLHHPLTLPPPLHQQSPSVVESPEMALGFDPECFEPFPIDQRCTGLQYSAFPVLMAFQMM